jgi:CRP/FNR family transcriptional regulator
MTFHEFVKQYPSKKFLKGEVILCEGAIPPCAYVIKNGIIKAYSLTQEGMERPVAFIRAWDTFTLGWVMQKLKWSQYYYAALIDCELFCIPRNEYVEFIKAHADVLYDFYVKFIELFVGYQMRISALERSKASEKVLHTMHFLSLRYGQDIAPDTVRIPLPLTQQDMANLMGITRETAGIELKKLEKAGVITYQRQLYIVHTNKLGELLEFDYEFGEVRTPQVLPFQHMHLMSR